VLFESPHRVAATLDELAAELGGDRPVAVARELTKLHEEVWRGRLADAAAAVGGPRGEYVVVLGPAAAPVPAGASDVEEAVRAELDQGASARDAAAAVSDALGVPKRQVYAVATRLRGGTGEES
jgi:16S rRNA (cytidine1402-2'-O)-methyltransferase